jgi:hypothetical protein
MVDQAVLLVDTSRWPLAVLTYAGRPSNEQLEEHLKEIEEKVLARGDYFVQVIDQSRGEMPDALQRSLIAQHQERMEAQYTKYCLGEAYVVTPQIRGAMVAVFWLAKPPYPYTFVDTLGEAVAWARTRLAEPPRA